MVDWRSMVDGDRLLWAAVVLVFAASLVNVIVFLGYPARWWELSADISSYGGGTFFETYGPAGYTQDLRTPQYNYHVRTSYGRYDQIGFTTRKPHDCSTSGFFSIILGYFSILLALFATPVLLDRAFGDNRAKVRLLAVAMPLAIGFLVIFSVMYFQSGCVEGLEGHTDKQSDLSNVEIKPLFSFALAVISATMLGLASCFSFLKPAGPGSAPVMSMDIETVITSQNSTTTMMYASDIPADMGPLHRVDFVQTGQQNGTENVIGSPVFVRRGRDPPGTAAGTVVVGATNDDESGDEDEESSSEEDTTPKKKTLMPWEKPDIPEQWQKAQATEAKGVKGVLKKEGSISASSSIAPKKSVGFTGEDDVEEIAVGGAAASSPRKTRSSSSRRRSNEKAPTAEEKESAKRSLQEAEEEPDPEL